MCNLLKLLTEVRGSDACVCSPIPPSKRRAYQRPRLLLWLVDSSRGARLVENI